MAVHTASVRWRDGSDEFHFLSLDGELYLEVQGIPDNTAGIEDQIQARMEGRGKKSRPMLWHRRGIRAMQSDGHAVSFSDPEEFRSAQAVAEKIG